MSGDMMSVTVIHIVESGSSVFSLLCHILLLTDILVASNIRYYNTTAGEILM
jgi:hypothetical protein